MDNERDALEAIGQRYHDSLSAQLSEIPVEAQLEMLRIIFSSLIAIFLANRGSAETAAFLRRQADAVEADAVVNKALARRHQDLN